jgi:hypothetical protein
MAREVAYELMMEKDWLGAANALLLADLPVPAGVFSAFRSFMDEPMKKKAEGKRIAADFFKKTHAIHDALLTKDKTITFVEVKSSYMDLIGRRLMQAKETTMNHDGAWLIGQQADRVKERPYNGPDRDKADAIGSRQLTYNFGYKVNKEVAPVLGLRNLHDADEFLTLVISKIFDKRYDLTLITDSQVFSETFINNEACSVTAESLDDIVKADEEINDRVSLIGIGDYTRRISRDPHAMDDRYLIAYISRCNS